MSSIFLSTNEDHLLVVKTYLYKIIRTIFSPIVQNRTATSQATVPERKALT